MESIGKNFWWRDETPEEYRQRYLRYCHDCEEYIYEEEFRTDCKICYKIWHVGCIPSSPEDINHPYHLYHPLKLLFDGPPHYSNGKCNICQKELKRFFYHCLICDYNMHVRCSKDPPTCHEHTLSLMARIDRFTCNACGTYGEQCPYICAPCSLMFHHDCIKPHLININCHDDRIYHTYSLDFGDWKCPICHKKIDWRYGAYSCAKCHSYAVHSKCATRRDVWDGVELEDVPEEFFDVSPFKVIEEGVINHFSHEKHNLRFVEDGIERDRHIRCEGCAHPIFSEKHYNCMECNYTLHDTCANLPLQKRHGLNTTPLTLITTKKDENVHFFVCHACNTISNGFRYASRGTELDLRCATVSYHRDYECHPHTLFLTTLESGTCGGCQRDRVYVLNCVECVYSLCFKCATLPKKIKHRSDDHFLLLRYGEKAEGKYWCEVCETVVDPQSWFYTCDDCVVVCHIKCVLGEFMNGKPGFIRMKHTEKVEFVYNDSMMRPNCRKCESLCKLPLVLQGSSSRIKYFCCTLNCMVYMEKP